jgi:hypothetical protein
MAEFVPKGLRGLAFSTSGSILNFAAAGFKE